MAGQFYPDDPKELRKALKTFSDMGKVPVLEGEPLGFLLPHAGYPFSGSVAALGYLSLVHPVETLVVAGPSHYLPFRGVSIFGGNAVTTPLGDLEVDQEAARFLMEFDPNIAEIPPAFAREHSVEVHLPMIQTYLPKTKVVPIVMGQGVEEAVKPLSEALLALFKSRKFIFVASSDLSHYPNYETAVKADHGFLKALLTGEEKKVDEMDVNIMARGYPDYYCTHCGKEPVSTLMRFAKGMRADKIRLLAYRNSGDVIRDRSRVVGYSAVAFCR